MLDVANSGSSLLDEVFSVGSADEVLLAGRNSAEQSWNYDPSEPRYCVCDQVSYGDMVACDNVEVSFSGERLLLSLLTYVWKMLPVTCYSSAPTSGSTIPASASALLRRESGTAQHAWPKGRGGSEKERRLELVRYQTGQYSR